MENKSLSLALVQHACSGDPGENLERACRLVEEAAGRGASLVCLQELFHTTYFCREMEERYFDWAEPADGPLAARLGELAGDLDITLVAPFFECRAPGLYHNALMVISREGNRLGIYRKKHIPDDPGFYEKYYFAPGEDSYRVYDTGQLRIGPLICWDQWFPEAARITALKGAELLIYPTAIGALPEEDEETEQAYLEAWTTIQRSHAIANGCYVAAINRVGTEGGTRFWGQSFVAGPFGEIMGRAGTGEEILQVELDRSAIERQRRTWPFFRDRRIDTYAPILKRYDD